MKGIEGGDGRRTDREPSPDQPARRGGSTWKAAWWVLLLFLGLVTVYERVTVLQQLERLARDFTAQIRSPRDDLSLSLVRIDASDYARLFASTSPLDVDGLERVLDAIVAGRPRLIVVDVETGRPEARRLGLVGTDVPIVWARSIADCAAPGCSESASPSLTAFAGLDHPGARYGLVELPRDPDGVVRRYRRYFEVGDSLRPTLAAAAMAALGEPVERSGDPLFIRYREIPVEGIAIGASRLLAMVGEPGFGERGLLRDRIVILGGTFPEARDRYATPLGEMAGMEIHAQILQTELEGGGLAPVGLGIIGLLLLVDSVGLLLLFHFVRELRLAFWIAVVAIPVLATAGSWLAAGSAFALWPYLVPLLVAVLIQQLYAHALRYRDELLERLGERVAPGLRTRRREAG